MISERKLQANRLNAQKSTGPRTPEGKAAVARNPITHGLRARNVVMPIENRAEFEKLCDDLFEQWQPMTASEIHMVEQMACSRWKQARLERMITITNLQSAFIHLAFRDPNRYRTSKGTIRLPDITRNDGEYKMQRAIGAMQQQMNSLERSYRQGEQTLEHLQELRRKKMERGEKPQAPPRQEEPKEKVMTATAGAPFDFEFEPQPEPKPAGKVTRFASTWDRMNSA